MVLENWSTFSWDEESGLTITLWVEESLQEFIDKSNIREPYKVFFNIKGPKAKGGYAKYRQRVMSEIKIYVRQRIIEHAEDELGKELIKKTLFIGTISKATGVKDDDKRSPTYWIQTFISEYPIN